MNLIQWVRGWVDFEKDLLDKGMASLAPLASGRMVDVGCGDKPYEALFAPHVTDHLGIDFEETHASSAYAQSSKADLLYTGARLPFADGVFDTVLCTQVLEHVPEPWHLFTELNRILRPGGTLILTAPFSYRVHSEPHDFFRFTKYALVRLAEENGMQVLKILPRGGFWAVIGQKLGSYFALNLGRLGGEVQRIGGLRYEKEMKVSPRYWALPFVIPAVFAIATVCRLLDRWFLFELDTLGYFLVAKRPETSGH